jgi:hypothetical protein
MSSTCPVISTLNPELDMINSNPLQDSLLDTMNLVLKPEAIVINNPVPEPNTAALLGASLAFLALTRAVTRAVRPKNSSKGNQHTLEA